MYYFLEHYSLPKAPFLVFQRHQLREDIHHPNQDLVISATSTFHSRRQRTSHNDESRPFILDGRPSLSFETCLNAKRGRLCLLLCSSVDILLRLGTGVINLKISANITHQSSFEVFTYIRIRLRASLTYHHYLATYIRSGIAFSGHHHYVRSNHQTRDRRSIHRWRSLRTHSQLHTRSCRPRFPRLHHVGSHHHYI